MDALVQQMVRSPRLIEQLEELNRIVAREHVNREAFREWLKPEVKAEFICGEVVMHSPAKRVHNRVRMRLESILSAWIRLTGEGEVASEKALCVFPRNDFEPDLVYFGPAKASMFSDDMVKYPVPDFVVEVLSASTEHRDRGVKFEDYGAHGVTEYWIIDPELEVVEQYVVGEQGFDLRANHDSGVVSAVALPGLAMPIRAIFRDDALGEFLETLRP